MDKQADLRFKQMALEHIKVSHAALDAAKKQIDQIETQDKAAAALIPGIVQKLIDKGRVYPEYATKLAEILRDPVKALEMLGEVADPTVGVRQAVGTPTAAGGPAVKTASDRGPNVLDLRGRQTEADERYNRGVVALAQQLGKAV